MNLKLDVAQDKIMIANTTLIIASVMIAFASYWTGNRMALLLLYSCS